MDFDHSPFPRVMHPGFGPRDNLLGTRKLEMAYDAASDPSKKEVATTALFEFFFRYWMECEKLGVMSQQKVKDSSDKAPDLCLGFHQEGVTSPRSLADLESELREYAELYLDKPTGGLAKHPFVYAAAAIGTKIRFFLYDYVKTQQGGYNFNVHTEEGPTGRDILGDPQYYWDLKTDGRKIHRYMQQIWQPRAEELLRPIR